MSLTPITHSWPVLCANVPKGKHSLTCSYFGELKKIISVVYSGDTHIKEILALTSMTVHCSTTMASYVVLATFGSLSLPSWKMKTLSTDFGSTSAERRGKKKNPVMKKSIYWMERVRLVSAAALGPAGQRKWNDITQPQSHTSLYYIANGVGRLCEPCALIHYAGRQC